MEKLILLVSEYLCLYQMELPEYNNIVMKNNAWEKHFIRDASAILLQRIFHIIVTAASRKYAALSSAHTWVFSAGFGGNVAWLLLLAATYTACVFFFFIKYFFI